MRVIKVSRMNKFELQPNKEGVEKFLFRVTLMRHEEPYYKDEGHDLTPQGVENAKATGEKLRASGHINPEDKLYLFHSPKPRAQGTLEFVAEGAGISHETKRPTHQLRSSDIPDREKFMERVVELEHDQEAIAKDHHTNTDLYENNPEFIEPAAKKKERLYRTLEYLIRSFEKTRPANETAPHIIAVSHFEIITYLIDDVFGIESMGKYNAPAFGEAILIEAYSQKDENSVKLKITFKEHSREVLFKRSTRTVEVL